MVGNTSANAKDSAAAKKKRILAKLTVRVVREKGTFKLPDSSEAMYHLPKTSEISYIIWGKGN